MAKVLGVGGIFFKTQDAAALREWYARVLGLEISDWGMFFTPDMVKDKPGSGTVFSAFSADSDYFKPSEKEFMFNLIVDDMDGMLARAKEAGVWPVKQQEESYGRFAHIIDLEGRKIELWEPKPTPEQT
ncbi:VOC family protein [Terricaulis silvestris]|uniref:Putative enzyme related to lactoylglutathione lyase n=1 Tax=Terricaulis silvestris TaxID=2686094 RepID=A0A6I6MSP9_9CAUL|nr:VOC family protein [Terricaulis silvestris]QGZ96368.1 putative enzyme related to lactoylglutathione lyase [Terricaulis silvestris]